MKQKKLFQKFALTLGFTMSLVAQTSHADLGAVGLTIVTAPILLPLGIYDAYKTSKAKKEQAKRYEENERSNEEYKRAEVLELASFVQRGCKLEDLTSPEFKKALRHTRLQTYFSPSDFSNEIKYLSDDSKGVTLRSEDKARETFGQIDDIPTQEARKIAIKKLKEMDVTYTNAKKKLVDIRQSDDWSQLSKEDRQLVLNFACDSAQVEVATNFFKENAKARALAIQARDQQSVQASEAAWQKRQKEIYGVN